MYDSREERFFFNETVLLICIWSWQISYVSTVIMGTVFALFKGYGTCPF
jgi:hypothetical protein